MDIFQNIINTHPKAFKTTIGLLFAYLINKWIRGGVNHLRKDMTGKIIIITGSNTGIGYEVAKFLAKNGATIIFACRSKEKALNAINKIQKETNNKDLHFIRLDLNDLESVQQFTVEYGQKFEKLDILVNNAGVYTNKYQQTKQRLEQVIGVNHVGPFLLTQLLLPILEKTQNSKIINVSSLGHKQGANFVADSFELHKAENFKMSPNYCYAKFFMNSTALSLAQKLDAQGNPKNLRVLSVHPGVVRTEIARNLLQNRFLLIFALLMYPILWFLSKSPWEGAQTILYLAMEENDKLENGGYYADCQKQKMMKELYDKQKAQWIWDQSQKWASGKI